LNKKRTRHPTKKKVQKPTHSHTSISIGKDEKEILGYLINNPDTRFNVKGFSKNKGIARSTLIDRLNRMVFNGLIIKPNVGNHVITPKGRNAYECVKGGVGKLRKGCRKRDDLSQHFTRYKLELKEKNIITPGILSEIKSSLNILEYKKVELRNLLTHYLYLENGTIIITSKKLIIRVHDIVGLDTEETNIKSMDLAFEYLEKLNSCGVEGDTLKLDNVHFARMESIFSEILTKIDDKFSVDLGNGRKFWIDGSNDSIEDETNDEDAREKIDSMLRSVVNSDSNYFKDLDKMKDVLSLVVKLIVMDRLPPKVEKFDPAGVDYFG